MKCTRFYLLTLALTVGLSSCKEDNNAPLPPVTDGFLIQFVKTENTTIKELTYTSDGNIYELVEPYSYKRYRYNSQHQLTRIEQVISIDPAACFMPVGDVIEPGADPRKAGITQYFEFEYSSAKLSKRAFFYMKDGNPMQVSHQTYEYQNNNIYRINIYNPGGTLTQYYIYEYDEKGNVHREDFYTVEAGTDATLLNTTVNEYDNKLNPFRVFASEGTPGLFTNTNNILSSTITTFYQGSQQQNTFENTYEYNTFGYPKKAGESTYLYVNNIQD